MRIGILGSGTWGTALSNLLASKGYEVCVWSAFEEEAAVLSERREHKNLPGIPLDEGIVFTHDMSLATVDKDIVVFAQPSQFIRVTARSARATIPAGQLCVSVAKGIEDETFYTMTDIIADELNGLEPRLVALSGPTFATEVAAGKLSTILAASTDEEAALIVQDAFATSWMRVYTSSDPRGAEICGALKNVIALASGIARGLGCGENAQAALITRGLAEIKRLGLAMGCREATFYGLAGVGDLILTCSSRQSRNNTCGYLIGQGLSADEACKQVGMVVEGLHALPAALSLSERYNVDMPIAHAVDDIVAGRIPASDIIEILYSRQQKAE